MNEEKQVTAESITLYDEKGFWLGQVILTSDGLFASVTDYGNFNFVWRSYGDNFKKFLLRLNIPYFANKMTQGMSYVAHSKKIDQAAERFAEHILPALQKFLTQEGE
jgi:hypothetical protein